MNLTAQKLSGCTWGKKKLAAQKDERPRGPSILGTVGSTGQPTAQREARCRGACGAQSRFSRAHGDPMDCCPPPLLCMGFSRQEHCSGLLPDPGIEQASLIRAGLGAGDSGKQNVNMDRKRWPTLAGSKAVMQALRWSNSKAVTSTQRQGGETRASSSPLLPPSTFTTVMLPRPTPDSPPPHFSGHAAPAAATPIGSPPCNKHPGQRHVPGWLVPRELADAASCLPCVLLTQQCHPQERALRKQCRVHHDEHTRTLAAELFTY